MFIKTSYPFKSSFISVGVTKKLRVIRDKTGNACEYLENYDISKKSRIVPINDQYYPYIRCFTRFGTICTV